MAGEQSTSKPTAEPPADAAAWLPGERGEPVDMGGGDAGRDAPRVPKEDQPQSKVDLAAANKDQKDEVVVASEESFPASDPPSYQPVKAGTK